MEHLCVWCGKCFRDERKLKNHEQLYHFKPRFPCGVCAGTFSTKGARRKHAEAIHRLVPGSREFCTAVASEANKPTAACPKPIVTVESFPCGFCSSTFALKPILYSHLVGVHGLDNISAEFHNDIKPSMQNMSLPSIAPISRTFKCKFCTSVFPSRITRKQHLIENHGFERGNIESHNAFNPPVFNAPILQGTTFLQQNQTYQPSYIPIENSYQVIEQNNVEYHYDIKPTIINAPIKQATAPKQQNQIYQPPDIQVENLYQATSVQMSMNEQYQIVNPLNVMNHHFNYNNQFNNSNPNHDSQKMSICNANTERTKLKDITVSGTNVVKSSFKDSSVHDMNVPKDFVIHTEENSPYFSNSTVSIPMSYTMSGVQCQDINELNVVNPNLNNSNPYSTYTSNCVVTTNEVKPIKCPVCNASLFEVNGYKQHIQSREHESASEINFNNRIDFEANTVFSNCTCTTVVQFLSAISKDFNTLIKHLLLLNNAILIDLSFMVLFNDNSNLINYNKNIVESKYFLVQNEKLTKDTDLHVFYDRIGKFLMSQYDEILNLNPYWTLDEMVSLEIIIKKHESEMRPMSLVTYDSSSIETGSPKKTEPLQLSKCKMCNLFLVQKNYEHHLDIIAHKIAMSYLDNKIIKVNPDIDNLQDCFLNCRFTPENKMSINVFLSSIELELTSLIYRVLELKLKSSIKTVLKLFVVYNKNGVQTAINNLVSVKNFTLINEIIHPYTSLPAWYHHITTLFESKHQTLVTNNLIEDQPCSLTCALYLDIDFYEVDTEIL